MSIVKAFMKEKKTGSSIKASVRALVEGGWLSQAQRFLDGGVDSPICRRCGKNEGTNYYMLTGCSELLSIYQTAEGKAR